MSGWKHAKGMNEPVYLTATTNPRIDMDELRRSLREEMKEAKKEAIRKERAA